MKGARQVAGWQVYKHGIDFLKVEGEVITDKQDIAKEFAALFSSIVGLLDEDTDNRDTCDTVYTTV